MHMYVSKERNILCQKGNVFLDLMNPGVDKLTEGTYAVFVSHRKNELDFACLPQFVQIIFKTINRVW